MPNPRKAMENTMMTYGTLKEILTKVDKFLKVFVYNKDNMEVINSVNYFMFWSDPNFKKVYTVSELMERIDKFDEEYDVRLFSSGSYNSAIMIDSVIVRTDDVFDSDGNSFTNKYIVLTKKRDE